MPADIDAIQCGQSVLSLDGESLGTVSSVYRPTQPSDAVTSATAGASDYGHDVQNTVTGAETLILENIEARGTHAGDIGLSTNSASTFGPDQPGHAPFHGPREISPAALGTQGYICVQQSGGILGIGTRDLYVPFSAVRDVTSDGITLLTTKDQTEDLYGEKPEFLES